MSMRVIVATDGSKQSLAAARHLMAFADASKITEIVVLAVISPWASVPFANELGPRTPAGSATELSFRAEAQAAVAAIAAVFEGWGPKVVKSVRSGSPAAQIVKAASQLEADLIVVASGNRGLSDTVLLGSTAQRIQHSAPCPVLVARPHPRTPKARRR